MTNSTGDFSSHRPFATVDLDVPNPAVDLPALHAQVVDGHGRIELVRDGGACVLISKDELQSLEQALEILSNTETMRAMRQEIALLARAATPRDDLPGPVPVVNRRMRSMNLP